MPAWKSVTLTLAALLAAWLGMQQVHELGHVLAAVATGGEVERVVLHPLTISRTDLAANPRPLIVVWAGPLFGALLPLVVWSVALAVRLRVAFLLRFFAGFCLIANGAYIGAGSFGGIGDCGEMLRHGSPIWLLWLFGLATVAAGLALWNGQGRHFGIGAADLQIESAALYTSIAALTVVLAISLIAG